MSTAPCCDPLTAGPLDEPAATRLAADLKVLADPARLMLLSCIAAAADDEACVCDLVEPTGRSQPTVSHHLGVLQEAGFVTREKRGRWAWYRVVPERLAEVAGLLSPR